MKRIIFAYPDLMNQYGEYANLLLLKKRLEAAGEEVTIDAFSIGDRLSLNDCSFLYFGAGTERSALRALADLSRFKSELFEFLKGGGLCLATGSSSLLFCEAVTLHDGAVVPGLSLTDLTAEITPSRRYSEFIMTSELFPKEMLIGSINTSSSFSRSDSPLFKVMFDAAKNLGADADGAFSDGLFVTQLLGPLLVKNPTLLDFFAGKILGFEPTVCKDRWYSLAVSAHDNMLSILTSEAERRRR